MASDCLSQSPVPNVRSSSVYTIIPLTLYRRIPSITSVRRSVQRTISTSSTRTHSPPDTPFTTSSERDSISETSTVSSSGSITPVRPSTPEETETSTRYNELELQRNMFRRSPVVPDMKPGGVDLETAALGMQIWQNALRRYSEGTSPSTIRSRHLDAVVYMLHALPEDLTDIEVTRLGTAMPMSLCEQKPSEQAPTRFQTRHNFLRDTTARTVSIIIALVVFLVPIFTTLLNQAIRYERQHRLTQRAINSGTGAVKAMAGVGLDMSDTIVRLQQSALGRKFGNVFFWILQSIIAGINDGMVASSGRDMKVLDRRMQLEAYR